MKTSRNTILGVNICNDCWRKKKCTLPYSAHCDKYVCYLWKWKRRGRYYEKLYKGKPKFPMSLATWIGVWKLPF